MTPADVISACSLHALLVSYSEVWCKNRVIFGIVEGIE